MSRTARLWKGAGALTLGGFLLSGTLARGAEPAPLPEQLLGLARQAASQGRGHDATAFYRQVLKLDPKNAEARKALAARADGLRRVAFQPTPAEPEPAPAEPAPAAENPAPAEAAPAAENPAPAEPAPAAENPAPAVPAPAAENPAPAVEPTPAPAPAPAEPAPTPLPPEGSPDAVPAEPTPADARATLERVDQMREVQQQELTGEIRRQIERARQLVQRREPQAALETLRLAQNALQAAEQIDDAVRAQLDRQVQLEYRTTLRREEEIELARAEELRLQASAAQRERMLEALETNEEKVNALMTQFDTLMAQGQFNVLFNGGLGDIAKTTAPFYDARILAMQARALAPREAAPRAGLFVSQSVGFLSQSLAFREIKEFRYMQTLQDVERAAIPFPDTTTIEYPDADFFRTISETRRKKYESTDLVNLDQRTKDIMGKLDQVVSMPFAEETPLGDVIKYIKTATSDNNMPQGLPIYLDKAGLTEAEATEESMVKLEMEGVPLKTTLRLLLKQLGLNYSVKDGLLTITSEQSENQPTEIRVYPVADLSIIPFSLMGGGGMGGGMGGMGGGGMGGMGGGGMGGGGMGGGGMGGMGGGGMGGMGGGMGGFGSVPPADPNGAFMQKKSN